MRSIKFPKIFNANTTRVWKPEEHLNATKQNMKLTLLTGRGEIFGDPYFGLLLKQYMFNQNTYILRDIIIDMIYTQLALFMPQLYVERKNITIIQDRNKGELVCQFSALNKIDYTINTYNLVLLSESI